MKVAQEFSIDGGFVISSIESMGFHQSVPYMRQTVTDLFTFFTGYFSSLLHSSTHPSPPLPPGM